MPPADTAPTETLEIDAKERKFKVSGPNAILLALVLLSMLTLMGVTLTAYALYRHQEDAATAGTSFVAAIKEQTVVMREGASLQREQNCIMRIPADIRARDPEMCKILGR